MENIYIKIEIVSSFLFFIFMILVHLMNKFVSKVSDLKLITDKDVYYTQFIKAQE
jgi:hypothetical protein